MKKLIMPVGLPRSGKSTWCKSTGFPMVNPDSIRIALHGEKFIGSAEPMVWVMARYMVKSLFEAGHDTVILDATNITKARRDEWISKSWVREFHFVPTISQICMDRAIEEGSEYLIPIIIKMSEQFEPVGDEYMEWEYNG